MNTLKEVGMFFDHVVLRQGSNVSSVRDRIGCEGVCWCLRDRIECEGVCWCLRDRIVCEGVC